MKVLILGGTSESRSLAEELQSVAGFETVTSLAGRVADPTLPVGETRIGGFGGPDAMALWLRDNVIDAVVDATHPFAATISAHAARASAATSIPLIVLAREPWSAQPRDTWTAVESVTDAAASISAGNRVFLTIGRQGVHHFADRHDAWFLVRAIDRPLGPVPPNMTLLLERGPFDVEHEATLMRRHRIDVLVTKNSGGEMTQAKLEAARELAVRVLMIERPSSLAEVPRTHEIESVVDWLHALGRRVST